MKKRKFLGQSAMVIATVAQIGAPIVSANTTTKAPAQTTKAAAATTQTRVLAKKADKPQVFDAAALIKAAPDAVQFDLAPFREKVDEIKALQDEIAADETKLDGLEKGSADRVAAQKALNDKRSVLNDKINALNEEIKAKIAEANDKIKADNATATQNVTDQVTKVNADN